MFKGRLVHYFWRTAHISPGRSPILVYFLRNAVTVNDISITMCDPQGRGGRGWGGEGNSFDRVGNLFYSSSCRYHCIPSGLYKQLPTLWCSVIESCTTHYEYDIVLRKHAHKHVLEILCTPISWLHKRNNSIYIKNLGKLYIGIPLTDYHTSAPTLLGAHPPIPTCNIWYDGYCFPT